MLRPTCARLCKCSPKTQADTKIAGRQGAYLDYVGAPSCGSYGAESSSLASGYQVDLLHCRLICRQADFPLGGESFSAPKTAQASILDCQKFLFSSCSGSFSFSPASSQTWGMDGRPVAYPSCFPILQMRSIDTTQETSTQRCRNGRRSLAATIIYVLFVTTTLLYKLEDHSKAHAEITSLDCPRMHFLSGGASCQLIQPRAKAQGTHGHRNDGRLSFRELAPEPYGIVSFIRSSVAQPSEEICRANVQGLVASPDAHRSCSNGNEKSSQCAFAILLKCQLLSYTVRLRLCSSFSAPYRPDQPVAAEIRHSVARRTLKFQ